MQDRPLTHRDGEDPLERTMEAFDLSKTQLAVLFGVGPQAVDDWLVGGVPA